jgi:diguanylate cyclase (GGDEF)-like protein
MPHVSATVKILIIDDNPLADSDFIKILTDLLPQAPKGAISKEKEADKPRRKKPLPLNFKIETATQGKKGAKKVAKAVQNNHPFALAFVDISLPSDWDGIETAKKIWEIDANIQIILCTPHSDCSGEKAVEQLGQRENLLFLKKPFDALAVKQLCNTLIERWQLLQETRQHTNLLEKQVKERTHFLQESLSVTRGTLESSTDGILVVNKDYTIIDYNNTLMRMFKIDEAIDNKNADVALHSIAKKLEESQSFLKLAKKLKTLKNKTTSLTLKSNGRILEIFTQPYKLKEKISGRIWYFRDITKRALLEEELQFQATHDSLTRLPNRVLLSDRLAQLISFSKRNNTFFCVLFFDLDRFKLINDSFSHFAGDKLLQEVAQRLGTVIREEDTLARLGGDEFVAILKDLKDETHAAKIAKKLLQTFSTPFNIDSSNILITASIGIATYPRDGHTMDELLRNADIAMYRAKEQGGNRFHFYTQRLGKKSIAGLKLEAELYRALEKKEFFLCYQPQIDLASRKLVSAEALIRWRHPERGIVLPIEFIPLATEIGLSIPMGEWVLNEACKQNKQWQNKGLPKIRIAVNVAAEQLKQKNFIKTLNEILAKTKLDPQYLEIEITENISLTGFEAATIFKKLKKAGIHLALDNFGSGYTILNHLKLFPLDKLKIDRSYINHIHYSRVDELIIEAIISLANNLHLEVLAEGIESKEQIEFLTRHQCGKGQGYYFSRPLTAKEFQQFLQKMY